MKSSKSGFTFIDILVGITLLSLIFLGILGAYLLGIKVISQSKSKITATAIGNHQIETIRNLPYGSIGVIGGFPEGVLEPTESIVINNTEYIIETRVDFVIDSVDGISSPEDDCPNDYKKIGVKISWSTRFEGDIEFFTDIAPKNLAQECGTEGGILLVSVFDAYGIMVPSPQIEVKNPETNETLKFAAPIDGKYYFSLATSTYKVVISKENYSTERTYGTDEISIPEKPHTLILEGELIEISFSIDKLSSMTVKTQGKEEDEYPIIQNAMFTLTGTKIIGIDSDENPVYKYSQNHITNELGEINIPNLEWDSYNFFIDPDTGLDLLDINPSPQPIDLFPDTSLLVNLYLEAENSLLLTVQNIETGLPIFAASVRLFNEGLGYNIIQYTDEKGQTYFIPLEAATYNLEIEAPGYSNFSDSILISEYITEIVNLQQVE